MKKNKGFTLVELLAVLIILAIIALVVTPIVTGLIKDAQKKAAEDALNGVIRAAEVYYGRQALEYNGKFNGGNDMTLKFGSNGNATPQNGVSGKYKTTITFNYGDIYDGYKVENGTITIKANGSVTASNLEINGYKCNYTSSTNITCTEMSS